MKEVKDIAKKLFENGKWYLYHLEHKKVARKMLKNIESDKGKLSTKNKKLCEEYSKDVFGDIKYAPWLYVYCAYAKEFREGWIPDNYFGEFVVPQLNGDYGTICNRNAVIDNLLQDSESLDICYYVNKLFLSPNYQILNEEKIKKILFSESQKVVYKIEDSRAGKGIFILDENNFNLETIKNLGNGVFQSHIEQHSFFKQFSKSAVANVRITTVIDDKGKIQANSGLFKFGTGTDTYVKSDTARYILFNIEDGSLFDKVFSRDFKSTDHLPDSELIFAGKVLPSFDDCKAKVIKLHHRIPFARCVGWDIILDKNNNVRLMEVNGIHTGIILNEMVQGPCFKGLNWENLRNKK